MESVSRSGTVGVERSDAFRRDNFVVSGITSRVFDDVELKHHETHLLYGMPNVQQLHGRMLVCSVQEKIHETHDETEKNNASVAEK